MNDLQEQFYQVMTRLRVNSRSRAAAVSEPREWFHDKNGVIVSRPLSAASKAASVSQVTKKYDMSTPSDTGTEQIYKCGAHDFETRNLIEFNRHIEGHEHSSRGASVPSINKAKVIADFLFAKRY